MCGARAVANYQLYKAKHSGCNDDPQLPDELNEFYCRFDKNSISQQSFAYSTEAPPESTFYDGRAQG